MKWVKDKPNQEEGWGQRHCTQRLETTASASAGTTPRRESLTGPNEERMAGEPTGSCSKWRLTALLLYSGFDQKRGKMSLSGHNLKRPGHGIFAKTMSCSHKNKNWAGPAGDPFNTRIMPGAEEARRPETRVNVEPGVWVLASHHRSLALRSQAAGRLWGCLPFCKMGITTQKRPMGFCES